MWVCVCVCFMCVCVCVRVCCVCVSIEDREVSLPLLLSPSFPLSPTSFLPPTLPPSPFSAPFLSLSLLPSPALFLSRSISLSYSLSRVRANSLYLYSSSTDKATQRPLALSPYFSRELSLSVPLLYRQSKPKTSCSLALFLSHTVFLFARSLYLYGLATISRLLKTIGLFCRI